MKNTMKKVLAAVLVMMMVVSIGSVSASAWAGLASTNTHQVIVARAFEILKKDKPDAWNFYSSAGAIQTIKENADWPDENETNNLFQGHFYDPYNDRSYTTADYKYYFPKEGTGFPEVLKTNKDLIFAITALCKKPMQITVSNAAQFDALAKTCNAKTNFNMHYNAALGSYTVNKKVAWEDLGRALHFASDAGCPPHAANIPGNLTGVDGPNYHSKYEDWVNTQIKQGKYNYKGTKSVDYAGIRNGALNGIIDSLAINACSAIGKTNANRAAKFPAEDKYPAMTEATLPYTQQMAAALLYRFYCEKNLPTAPSTPTAKDITGSSVTLSWGSVSGVTGYKVLRNGTQVWNGSATNCTVTGLAVSTTYSFTVKTYNANGDSAASPSKSVTTLSASSAGFSLAISGHSLPPTTHTQGTSFSVKGTIISNYDIDTVVIRFLNSAGNEISNVAVGANASPAPGTKTYNLANLDAKVLFNKLPAGTTRYLIEAADKTGWKKLVDHTFTVKAAAATTTTTAVTAAIAGYTLTAAQKDLFENYIFDAVLYADKNDDLYKQFGYDKQKLLNHFYTSGHKENRPVYSYTFDPVYYLGKYSDLRAAYGTDKAQALIHFLKFGLAELRDSSPLFSAGYYKTHSTNTDLKTFTGSQLIQHFINHGLSEGRASSAEYFGKNYRTRYADLQKAYGTTYKSYATHYLKWGRAEGRNAK